MVRVVALDELPDRVLGVAPLRKLAAVAPAAELGKGAVVGVLLRRLQHLDLLREHREGGQAFGGRPTDALWGIGAKTAKRLRSLGITTVRQLADADHRDMAEQLGPMTGPWLVMLARGHDRSPVSSTPYVARGRSREHTFQQDLEDWHDVRRELVRLVDKVATDVNAEGRTVTRVVVKVRFAPFTTRSHGQSLPTPTNEPAVLHKAALAALERFTEHRPVRLLGVRAELVLPDATDDNADDNNNDVTTEATNQNIAIGKGGPR